MIPVVESYIYLGISLDTDISIESICRRAITKGQKALKVCLHILSNKSIPTATRVMLFRSVVLGAASYGAEIWGGIKSRCTAFNTIMRQGLCACFGANWRGGAASQAMAIEADIPPFFVSSTVSRIRLYEKLRLSNDESWLTYLIKNPAPSGARKFSWVRQTYMLKCRLVRKYTGILGKNDIIDLEKLKMALWIDSESSSAAVAWTRSIHILRPGSPRATLSTKG